MASLWSAGTLSWRALAAEARYFLGERTDPPKLPLKGISAALTALGAALAATAGGHGIVSAAVFGAISAAGYLCFYGRDLKPHQVEVANIDGSTAPR